MCTVRAISVGVMSLFFARRSTSFFITPIYTYGIGSAYGGVDTEYVACANMGTISTALSNNISGELMRGTAEYGVWKIGMEYSVALDGYYTLQKGDAENNENAITAMNTKIATWNIANTPQCNYLWGFGVDGWPMLISNE